MAKIWWKKTVKTGDAAIPPSNPSHYGYIFEQWVPTSYLNVQENLQIMSEYSRQMFKVTFVVEGKTISEQNIPYKGSCIPPDVPYRPGYNFGWDREFTDIVKDTIITGMYRSAEDWYYVKFFDIDGNLIQGSIQLLKYGSSASAPQVSAEIQREGYNYIFQGWDRTFDFIESDLDVYAQYFQVREKMTLELTSGISYDFDVSDIGTSVNLTQSSQTKSNANLQAMYSDVMGKNAIVKSAVDFSYSITKISNYGFYGKYAGAKLTMVSFPKVKEIGNYAFLNDKFLASVQFPELTSIGVQSFKNNTSLVNMNTEKVINFDRQSFYGCSNLKLVDIASAQTIQDEAFRGCKNLAIQLKSDKLLHIGDSAFYGCINLFGDIDLPDAVAIGKNCFYSGTNRNVFSISIPKVTELDKNAFAMFSKTVTTLTLNGILKNDPNASSLWGIGSWNKTSPDIGINKAKRQVTITWVD